MLQNRLPGYCLLFAVLLLPSLTFSMNYVAQGEIALEHLSPKSTSTRMLTLENGKKALEITVSADSTTYKGVILTRLKANHIRNRQITFRVGMKVNVTKVARNGGGVRIQFWPTPKSKGPWKRSIVGAVKKDWKTYTLTVNVPDDAGDCYFGIFLEGAAGKVLIKDVRITVNSQMTALAEQSKWQAFLNVKSPATYDKIPASLKSHDGKEVMPLTMEMTNTGIDLTVPHGFVGTGTEAVLYHAFSSPFSGWVEAGASADWWMEIYANGKSVYSTMNTGNRVASYTPNAHVFSFPVQKGENLIAAKVKSGSAGWRFVFGVPTKIQNIIFKEDKNWKAVDVSRRVIVPGSALDQSNIADNLLPGPIRRLQIGPFGKLVQAGDAKYTPLRLHGSGWRFIWSRSDACKNPDWKQHWADNIVAFKRQGYNLIRFMGIDEISEGRDMHIPAALLADSDYFIKLCADAKVYIWLTIGGYGNFLKEGWGKRPGDYKLKMILGDPKIRKAWQYGATAMLKHVNPHRGLAWKDEPCIAGVELYNELNWGIFSGKQRTPESVKLLDEKYRTWLRQQYRDVRQLNQAWKLKFTSFDEVTAPAKFPQGSTKVSDNDYLLFLAEQLKNTAKWMTEVVRATGYQGLIGQFNISLWLGGLAARWEHSQIGIGNTYFSHPSKLQLPGSVCGQRSSIADAGYSFRYLVSRELANRPLLVTEYNHSFWNPYQHEGGLLIGAYSALQNYSGLMIHFEAVQFHARKRPLDNFAVYNSPVSRANEFLLTMLYLRGDVNASEQRIELRIPQKYLLEDCKSAQAITSRQTQLALISAFSLAFPELSCPPGMGKPSAPALVINPSGGSTFRSAGGGWAMEMNEDTSLAGAPDWTDNIVKQMKQKGILAKSNLSKPSEGIFQSDTGQIIMRTRENLLKVHTNRSEAVTLEDGKGEKVGALQVVNTNVPALVAACAVDKQPLVNSKRMVIIFSTRVVNTGMELSGDGTTMIKIGDYPILMRVGKVHIRLQHSDADKMAFYALALDGSRRQQLPVKAENGYIEINLDTATLKDGPTPFFELVDTRLAD